MYTPTTRLMRSRTDKIVAGVAGGIARYLVVDPVFVRLAFVAIGLSGIGLIIYPILWLIMPLEDANSLHTASTINKAERIHISARPAGPLDEGEEIPINNLGDSQNQGDVQSRRNRLLGIILVSVGVMVVVNMIAPGISRFLVPALFIAAGVLLLRRNK